MKSGIALLFAATILIAPGEASEWSEPVHVLHEFKPCVTYRAKLDGGYLLIEAALQPGWHTFAIDNEERAAERRAGQPSLGIDQPTKIELGDSLRKSGPWYQSPPKDFSKPQLRWYTFGYEDRAVFAAKVQRAGQAPAAIQIRGQACTDKTCKNIDVSLSVSSAPAASKSATPAIDLKELVQARQAE